VDHGGTIEIFDLMGYHPETSEELLPVTPEIVDRWKAQQARIGTKPPARVDPASHPWFDGKTGRPNIWYSPGENGALDFFDSPGFHPKTGKALSEITQEFANELRQKWLRQQFARKCDELAANPNDQNRRRTSRGVSYDELKTHITDAIQACEVAAQQPNDLTSQYQLARAVELVDPPKGKSMQDRLVKKGYPAAFDNLGSLLLHDRGCRQHCVNEAVKLFKKGADLGDPDSMMSLAEQIKNGQAKGNVIALYQRAANLGHPGAKRALEALAQQPMRVPPIFRRFPF
jgi:hypothetical protein